MRLVSSKVAISDFCCRYIFRNFIHETKIIMYQYVVPNGFSSSSKHMTLNSHFALNTVFPVESFSMNATGFKA